MMIIKERGIVLFDGVCNLCCFIVRFIIKRDPNKRFSFAAMQSLKGQQILMETKHQVADIHSVIYVKDGIYFYQSSAILNILLDLGGIWKIFYVFIIIPSFIRDYVYSFIAKTRYKIFGRRIKCMVPTEDLRDRFL